MTTCCSSPSSSRLLLQLGSRREEVPVDAAVLTSWGGLEALHRAAEAKFGLEPDSYSLHDEYGKVETDSALARASKMAAAVSGDFLLEVKEQPHWAKLRALEERLEQKLEQKPEAAVRSDESEERREMELEAMEEEIERRVMARVEAALEDLSTRQERVELRVSGSVSGLLQQLASEQASLRERLDVLTGEVEELKMLKQHQQQSGLPSSQSLMGLQAEVHLTMASTNLELRKEMQCMRDSSKLADHSLKLLQAEFRQLSEALGELNQQSQPKAVVASPPTSFAPSWARSGLSAMEEDCGIIPHRPLASEMCSPSKKALVGGAYSYTLQHHPAAPAPPPGSCSSAGAAAAPFVRSSALPRIESGGLLRSSQSLPQLRLRH